MFKHQLLRTVFIVLSLFPAVSAAQAQSVIENLPPAVAGTTPESTEETTQAPVVPAPVENFSVSDVMADVTADTAAHARDQALTQATRTAFQQLCQRLNAADASASLTDDALALMVRSFDIQSEKVSAKRYIGVYTIHFKPAAIQSHVHADFSQMQVEAKPAIQGPLSIVAVAVQTPSLAALMQLKRQLNLVPQIQRIDTLDLGRGVSHIALSFGGSIDELRISVTNQGLVLQQAATGEWQLFPASLVHP